MSALNLIIIAAFFFLLFLFSIKWSQSALAPAPLWNMVWAVLFASTALFGSPFNYDTNSVLVLVALVASFNLPSLFVGSTPMEDSTTERRRNTTTVPAWLIYVCIAASLAGLFELSSSLGTSVFSIRSIESLLTTGQANAQKIFRGESSLSVIASTSFAVTQVGAALLAVRYQKGRDRHAIFGIFLLGLTILGWSVVTTQRTYILVPVLWFAAALIATRVFNGERSISARSVLITLATTVGIATLVVFLRAVRIGGASASLSSETWLSARLWVAGYVPTFSAWYSDKDIGADKASWDVLSGVLNLLEPVIGLTSPDEPTESPYEYIGLGLTSNAGTMMRTAVGTGGFLWGILMVIVIAAVIQSIYRRALAGRVVPAAAYAGGIACIFWSVNAWFFNYGSRVLALIILVFLAYIASRQDDRRSLGVSKMVSYENETKFHLFGRQKIQPTKLNLSGHRCAYTND